jgi:single-stranded-DNA-specific exonuclease
MIETLKSIPEFFHKFGGHPQACGFSLKNADIIEDFKRIMLEKALTGTANIDLTPQIQIDAEIDLDNITWELNGVLEKFAPFGQANEEPIYAARGLTIVSIDSMGADGKHLRLTMKHNSHLLKKTVAFGFGDIERHPANWKANLKPSDKIDIVFKVNVNEWNGNKELQLIIRDIIKHPSN